MVITVRLDVSFLYCIATLQVVCKGAPSPNAQNVGSWVLRLVPARHCSVAPPTFLLVLHNPAVRDTIGRVIASVSFLGCLVTSSHIGDRFERTSIIDDSMLEIEKFSSLSAAGIVFFVPVESGAPRKI